jgi:hypothetical protein
MRNSSLARKGIVEPNFTPEVIGFVGHIEFCGGEQNLESLSGISKKPPRFL